MEATPSSLNHSEPFQNDSRHCERAKHARQSISQRALPTVWIAASDFVLLAMTDTELVIARRVSVFSDGLCHSPHGEERRSRVSYHVDFQFALNNGPRPSRRMASAMLLRMRAYWLARCSTAGIGWREPGAYGMTAE